MDLNRKTSEIQCRMKEVSEACIGFASTLVDSFRKERIGLHSAWLAQRAGKQTTAHKIDAWCPLNLFSRYHHGSLQIYWQLVFRDRTTRGVGYRHLAKTSAGGYDLRVLLGHAKDFERDLVAEYEEEAQLQRRRWAEITSLQKGLATLHRHNYEESALVRRMRAKLMSQQYTGTSEGPRR